MSSDQVDKAINRLITAYDQHKASCVDSLRSMYRTEQSIRHELERSGVDSAAIVKGMDVMLGALRNMMTIDADDELNTQLGRAIAKLAYLGLLDCFIAYGEGDIKTVVEELERGFDNE